MFCFFCLISFKCVDYIRVCNLIISQLLCVQSDDKNEILTAVRDAIDAGYRHFDTAWLYGTETQVGQAIREKIAEGVVKREDVYYVTKLWNTFHRPEHVERIFRESLANSGLDYIDLYLIHFPVAFTYNGDDQHWPKIADGVFDVE